MTIEHRDAVSALERVNKLAQEKQPSRAAQRSIIALCQTVYDYITQLEAQLDAAALPAGAVVVQREDVVLAIRGLTYERATASANGCDPAATALRTETLDRLTTALQDKTNG